MKSVQLKRQGQGYSPVRINRNHPAPPSRAALTSKEAAAYLGICDRTLWKLVREGKIPCKRTGRQYAFSTVVLDRWLNCEPVTPPTADIEPASYAGAETV